MKEKRVGYAAAAVRKTKLRAKDVYSAILNSHLGAWTIPFDKKSSPTIHGLARDLHSMLPSLFAHPLVASLYKEKKKAGTPDKFIPSLLMQTLEDHALDIARG